MFAISAVLLLLVSLTILGTGIIIEQTVSQDTQRSLGTPVEVVSIGANAILSIGLIFVYLRIRDIQRDQEKWMQKQTETQKGQQELMEDSHRPLLQVINVDSYDGFIWPKIRNIGNGPTTEMAATIHFHIPNLEKSIDTDAYQMSHSADSDALELGADEASEIGSLSPGETGKMATEIRSPNLDPSGNIGPISVLINQLADEGVDKIQFQIEISYEHLMSTKGTGRHYLELRETSIQPQMSLNSLVDEAQKVADLECAETVGNFNRPGTYYDREESLS